MSSFISNLYRIEAISGSDSSQSVSEDGNSQISYEGPNLNNNAAAASKFAPPRPEKHRVDRGARDDSMDYSVSVNESSAGGWITGKQ